MASVSDVIEDFVSAGLLGGMDDQEGASGGGYRVKGYELFHDADEPTTALAGWEDPGTIDARVWIDRNWTGGGRTALEQALKQIPMVMMFVEPTEQYSDRGTTVTWWARPMECMSCRELLTSGQRIHGLCDACLQLRHGGDTLLPGRGGAGGYQQREGLHGPLLPRDRPTRG